MLHVTSLRSTAETGGRASSQGDSGVSCVLASQLIHSSEDHAMGSNKKKHWLGFWSSPKTTEASEFITNRSLCGSGSGAGSPRAQHWCLPSVTRASHGIVPQWWASWGERATLPAQDLLRAQCHHAGPCLVTSSNPSYLWKPHAHAPVECECGSSVSNTWTLGGTGNVVSPGIRNTSWPGHMPLGKVEGSAEDGSPAPCVSDSSGGLVA